MLYIDNEMKNKIEEYNNKYLDATTIEEQINLDQEYKDVTILKSQFNEFINYVIENKGKLPSQGGESDEEQQLGRFRVKIQLIYKRKNKINFGTKLSLNQLKYLHDSENEGLREIYKVILNKAIENKIQLPYIDNEMKNKIEEYNNKYSDATTIEEQIKLDQEYKDVIIQKSQFNEFINFVIENKGKMPSTVGETNKEQKLGKFRSSIQGVQILKNKINFFTTLSLNQLKYLHDSVYEGLREIYDNIIDKAYSINHIDYINIDNIFWL